MTTLIADVVTFDTPGPPGPTGPAGPVQIIVADAASLTATSTAGLAQGTMATVQALGTQNPFQYLPGDVGTPDSVTRIAAQGGGNWVVIQGPGVFGIQSNGTMTCSEGPVPGVMPQPPYGVAGGVTAAFAALPGLTLADGEATVVAGLVYVASNVPATAVTAATNTTPIVATLASAAGLATADIIKIVGASGMSALNGSFYYSLSGSSITLYRDKALTVPVAGNGTYLGGAVATSRGFAHFERRTVLRNCGVGLTVNTQGATTDTDLTFPIEPTNASPSMVGVSLAFVLAAGTVMGQITTPSGLPVLVWPLLSTGRCPQPGVGPPPSITGPLSVSTGPSTGGPAGVTVPGLNFTGTFDVSIVVESGPGAGSYPVTIFAVSAGGSIITFTPAAGPTGGGVGDLVITTPNGQAIAIGAWTYTADSFAIFGANAHVYKAANVVHSGGTVTAWNDQNGTPANAAPSGTPTYNAASTNWAPTQPSVSCNGSTDYFTASIPWPNHASIFGWAIVRSTKTATDQTLVQLISNLYFKMELLTTSCDPSLLNVVRTQVTVPTSVLNTRALIWAIAEDGTVGAGGIQEVSLNNGAPVSATGVGQTVAASTYTLTFGRNSPNNLDYFQGEVVEFGICPFASGTQPTSQQLAALHAYAQSFYGDP